MFMENTLVKALVAVAIIAYTGYTTFKSIRLFLTFNSKKKSFLEAHKDAQLYRDSQFWYIGAALLTIASFVCAFLSYTVPAMSNGKDPFYFVLAYFCIGIVFAGLAFETYVRKRVYFFDEGIFYVDKIYRYRIMMNFEARKSLVQNVRILMAGGEKIEVSKKMGLMIEDKVRARKADKKNKKKH